MKTLPDPSLDAQWNERADEQGALVRHWMRELVDAARDLQKLLTTKQGPQIRMPKVRTICTGLRWPASEDARRSDVILTLVDKRRWEGFQLKGDATAKMLATAVCSRCRHRPAEVLTAVDELRAIVQWHRDRIEGYSRAVASNRRAQMESMAALALEAEAVVAGLQRTR
jgi:hypothetical protein